jgi:hypothetical protein
MGRHGHATAIPPGSAADQPRRPRRFDDLAQAADYHADTIQEKLDKGTRDAVMFNGMACAVMVTFTFEANVNFMGFELNKAGKLPN